MNSGLGACIAVIEDARLLEESVQTHRDNLGAMIRELASEQSVIKADIETTLTVSNNVAFNFEGERPALMRVAANVQAKVYAKNKPERVLVSYSSEYVGRFIVRSFEGVKPGTEVPIAAVEAYIASINWLAARRADGSLAATGIANMRLEVPQLVQVSPAEQLAPPRQGAV